MLALLRASTAPSTYGRYANTKAGLLPALGNLCSKKPCLRPSIEGELAEGLLTRRCSASGHILGTSSPLARPLKLYQSLRLDFELTFVISPAATPDPWSTAVTVL